MVVIRATSYLLLLLFVGEMSPTCSIVSDIPITIPTTVPKEAKWWCCSDIFILWHVLLKTDPAAIHTINVMINDISSVNTLTQTADKLGKQWSYRTSSILCKSQSASYVVVLSLASISLRNLSLLISAKLWGVDNSLKTESQTRSKYDTDSGHKLRTTSNKLGVSAWWKPPSLVTGTSAANFCSS